MTGYKIIRRALPTQACDVLVTEAIRLWPEMPWRVSMPHLKSGVFMEAMMLPEVARLARAEIGECDGMGSDYFFHPPGCQGMDLHRDNDFVQTEPHKMISVWIALCDVSRANGCMYFDDVDIAVPKGDAIVIDSECVHGSHANMSESHRHALLITYIAKGAGFNPGKLQKRARVPLLNHYERME